jgi:hypothetical protein
MSRYLQYINQELAVATATTPFYRQRSRMESLQYKFAFASFERPEKHQKHIPHDENTMSTKTPKCGMKENVDLGMLKTSFSGFYCRKPAPKRPGLIKATPATSSRWILPDHSKKNKKTPKSRSNGEE